jgi:hypothetical protein
MIISVISDFESRMDLQKSVILFFALISILFGFILCEHSVNSSQSEDLPDGGMQNINHNLCTTKIFNFASFFKGKVVKTEKLKFGAKLDYYECFGVESRPKSEMRPLTIYCSKYELQDIKRGKKIVKKLLNVREKNLDCKFTGNPHSCGKYNNGGQVKFYTQLVTIVGSSVVNNRNCSPQTMTAELCPDVVYKSE